MFSAIEIYESSILKFLRAGNTATSSSVTSSQRVPTALGVILISLSSAHEHHAYPHPHPYSVGQAQRFQIPLLTTRLAVQHEAI